MYIIVIITIRFGRNTAEKKQLDTLGHLPLVGCFFFFLGGAILCALLFGDPNPDAVNWKKNMSAEKSLILRTLTTP